MNSPLPYDEKQRLQEVRRYAILDTPPEAAFERLTRLAARLFNVPIAIINLLDEDRQWFKSCYGLDMRETPREIALCAHAILTDEVLVVTDARQDARFADSPIVTGAEGVRFYAGAPLQSPDGLNIGVFAIMDRVPREMNDAEIATLSDLATLAVDEMELRLAATALRDEAGEERRQATLDLQRREEHLRSLIENASDIITVVDADGTMRYQSPSIERVLGYNTGELIGRNAFELIHPEDAGIVQEALRLIFSNPGLAQTAEFRFRHQDGSWRVLESLGKTLPGDSTAGAVINSRDITERKRNEDALQDAKDQLQVVLDTIPGGVKWIDSDLKYHGVNRYLAETFKVPAEKFIGQHIGFMDMSPVYAELVRDFMAGPQQQTSFEFAVDWNNSTRTIFMMARKYDEGRAAVLVGTDITARKQAEAALQQAHDELEGRVARRTGQLSAAVEELRQSEEHFRLLVEGTKDYAMFLMDTERKIVHWNAGAERITGYDKSAALSQTADIIFTPEDRERGVPEQERSEAAQNGRADDKRWHIRKDGTRFWADGVMTALYNDNGQLHGFAKIMRDATREKQTEQALQESEARFRSVTEAIPQQVWTARPDGALDYVNQRVLDYFGRTFEEMIGWSWAELIHPDDVPEAMARWQHSLQTGELYEIELRLKRAGDNTYRWNLGRALPLRDEQGRIVRWFGTNTDISERKEVEEKTHFQAHLLNTIGQAVIATDLQGTVSYWNRFAERLYGWLDSEAIGRNILDWTPTQATGQQAAEIMARLTAGESWSGEFMMQRRNGTMFPAQVTSEPVHNVAGTIVGIIGISTDITERKRAEEALRESEARKGAILETALDCIITIDGEGKVLEWNPAAENTFGFSRTQAIGQLMGELIIPASLRERHYQGIAHYLATGEGPVLGQRIEVPALRADGSEILVELSIIAIASDGTTVFTAYLRDITARKQNEEALKAAKTEAERANRAKSEFMSRMSHELRTPLNAILGFGQLLEMDELDAEQSQGVGQILKAGRHLLELINEVLDIARIEAEQQVVEIEPVPVVETLTGALDMVRPLAATRGIELRDDCGTDAGLFVLADRRRLNQVLLNLLANAVKYNREGGTATLSYVATEAGQLRIAISNTGLGLAPDKMSRLFMPFERLGAEQTEVEGTGLGLALSKRLVEAMGGAITVQSTLGEGSTFAVELPLAPEQTPLAAPLAQPPRAGSVTAERQPVEAGETGALVLYIEDNPANFGLVQNILRHRPEIKLLAAMRGSVGLELAQRHRPDLILLDYHLPDINGDEVLRLLQEAPATRDIPVVVVSADATPHQIERLRAAGAIEYLTKPLDVKRFLAVLDEKLGDAKTKGNHP